MRRPWIACLALAVSYLSGGPAPAAESVVDCAAFKAGWNAAFARAEPGRAELTFDGMPGRDGAVRVGRLAGLDATLTCREGKLGHVEMRGEAAALGTAAAAVLVALDASLGPAPAAELVAAMRAEAGPNHDAVSAWGPYEITYGRGQPAGRDTFTVDFAEN